MEILVIENSDNIIKMKTTPIFFFSYVKVAVIKKNQN